MDPSDDSSVKDENKEAKRPISKPPSPLNSSTPPRESVINGVDGNNRRAVLSSSTLRRLSSAPSDKFWEIAQEKDDASRLVPCPSSHSLRDRLSVLAHKINWDLLKMAGKEWFRNPMNWALFIWIIGVAVSGAILFLVMTGMLNAAIPKKSQRNAWFEVNNQIINALFTLMSLYQHPQRLYHLVLLLRWNADDIPKLRKIYCKNGTYKPHEWAHMLVVILLLNLNCFSQYVMCGLNVGYKRSERPAIGVGVAISFAIGSAAIAGLYTIVSPLGKEYDFTVDEESQTPMTVAIQEPEKLATNSFERRRSFMVREDGRIVETRPIWIGGIFDFWDDISVTYLSLFCSCCVFGWNMERLGFGNKYVHVATFILFCSAPFWIFNLAALNIDNDMTRQVLGLTGLVLCIFGLLYGGYWRIRMRKRFKLPGYTSCCGKPAVSDCALWLFCCWCSLAQEVRTANFYDIVEDKMCKKIREGDVEIEISQFPPEDDVDNGHSIENSAQAIPDDSEREGSAKPMTPPSPVLIKREGE
ncbi:hypothetical protein RND81_08G208100 [Saponaria officinalis]|uniref:PLAC8 family protein n=1 Tax=Saponaria officinalis TaxID=3572 RepID=A0AAW1JAF2_SAPOF